MNMKGLTHSIRSGLTLIEVILTMAIVGLVLTSVVAVLDLGLKSWRFQEEKGELLQNGRIAMRRIIEELRYANIVYNDGSDIIEFGTKKLYDNDTRIKYIREATTIYRSAWNLDTESDYGPQRKIASSIDTFTTTSTAAGLYEIELELSSGDNELELKNSAYPRN